MRFRLNVFFLLLFTLTSAPTSAGAATDAATCLSCHGSMKGVANVHKDSTKSPSMVPSIALTCHMPERRPAYGIDRSCPLTRRSRTCRPAIGAEGASRTPLQRAACVGCHPGQGRSVPGQHPRPERDRPKKSADGPVCTNCHGIPTYIPGERPSIRLRSNLFNIVEPAQVHEEKPHYGEVTSSRPLSDDIKEVDLRRHARPRSRYSGESLAVRADRAVRDS